MKKIALLSLCCLLSGLFTATAQNLTVPAGGGNKKASVSERIGITDVTLHYDRPAVKGREGQIWGKLVHYGFKDLGFGSSKAAPWRAGANENTTISFSTDVKVEGKDLPAGTYGLFMAMAETEATVIFSKNATSWGSYYYDATEDALRVTVKTIKTDLSVERLTFEFLDETDNSAVIALLWEKLKIPFKVEVDFAKTQLASFKTNSAATRALPGSRLTRLAPRHSGWAILNLHSNGQNPPFQSHTLEKKTFLPSASRHRCLPNWAKLPKPMPS